MSGSGGSGNGGELGGSEDGLDFLFGSDGPFGLPATSEEFFGTGPSTGRAEVGLGSFGFLRGSSRSPMVDSATRFGPTNLNFHVPP